MKKLFLSILMLMASVMAQAQVKIAPKLTVGQKMVYTNEMNSKSTLGDTKVTNKTTYLVSEKTSDGYIIDVTTTDFDVTSGQGFMGVIMVLTQKMVENITTRVNVDNDGKAIGIVNYDEMKQKSIQNLNQILDNLYAENPELAITMNKQDIIKSVEGEVSEAAFLKSIVLTPNNILTLNGKTISNQQTEKYLNIQDIQMKRTFTISDDGKTITADSKVDMTKDELKKFIIDKVTKSMPNQAEAMMANIDMVINSGMLNITGTEKTIYKFMDNGWIQSLNYTVNMNVMGQNINMNSIATLVQ